MMSHHADSTTIVAAQITIIGVGDWGCRRLHDVHPDVRAMTRLVAVHTDPLEMARAPVDLMVCLEEERSRPELFGTDPRSGYGQLQEVTAGSDLILVIGDPEDEVQRELIADVARSCLAVSKVVIPVCPVLIMDDSHLWDVARFGFPRWHAVKLILSIPDHAEVDDVVSALCQSLCGVILTPSVIGVDFADVRLVLEEPGLALVAHATGTGDSRAEEASRALVGQSAVAGKLSSAKAVLVVITAGSDLSLQEFSLVGEWMHQYVPADATVVMGVIHDQSMDVKNGQLKLSLVATGIRVDTY